MPELALNLVLIGRIVKPRYKSRVTNSYAHSIWNRENDNYLYSGAGEEPPKIDGTHKAYCWTIQHFLRFLDGRHPTHELGEEFIKHLEEKGNGPSSINRHISALKCYFRFKAMEFKIHGVKTDEYYPRILTSPT